MEYARATQDFNAAADKVWAAIADFGEIKPWTSVVDECVLEQDGETTVRVVKAMGVVFRERLVSLDADARQLVYAIEDPNILPFSGAEPIISVHEMGPNLSRVEWVGRAEGLDLPASEVAAMVEPIFTQSLQNLKTLVEG